MYDFSQIPNAFDERLKRQFAQEESFADREEVFSSIHLAFQEKPVVVLVGDGGVGKTSSAALYAWRECLAGALGTHPLLYFPFHPACNFSDLLESFGQVYEIALLERQIDWRTLDDFQRRKLIQDVFKKVNLLWIWDNFEVLEDRVSRAWPAEDRQALLEILRSIPQGGGKVLILSERSQEEILGDGCVRVHIQPGGPNYLAQKISSAIHLASPGEVDVDAHPDLPATLQLALSTFSEKDRNILPLMGLFEGILNQEIFAWMADEKNPWRVRFDDLQGNTGRLLEWAAALELCTPITSSGYFLLHPAIPGWLRGRLQGSALRNAKRAFTQAMAEFARQSTRRIERGEKAVIDLLAVEEANLRLALAYADRFRWRGILLDLLKALRLVYFNSRRFAAWENLLVQLGRHFVHPETHQPVSRKDRLIKDYLDLLVEACLKRDRLNQAANWQAIEVIWDRSHLADDEKSRPGSKKSRSTMVDLAGSLDRLAAIYRQMGSPKSIEAYSEVFQIALQVGNQRIVGASACQIAEAFISIPVAQNFEQAETWIQAGFELQGEDNLLRARLTALVGKMAYEKFLKVRKDNLPISVQVDYLNQALDAHFRALDLLPEDELSEQANLQETIGLLYLQSDGMLETAVEFYEQAMETKQQASDLPGAARTGYNLAVALFLLNDFDRSRRYAQAALEINDGLAVDGVIEAQKVRGFLGRFPGN